MNTNDIYYYTTEPLIQAFHQRSSSRTSLPLHMSFSTDTFSSAYILSTFTRFNLLDINSIRIPSEFTSNSEVIRMQDGDRFKQWYGAHLLTFSAAKFGLQTRGECVFGAFTRHLCRPHTSGNAKCLFWRSKAGPSGPAGNENLHKDNTDHLQLHENDRATNLSIQTAISRTRTRRLLRNHTGPDQHSLIMLIASMPLLYLCMASKINKRKLLWI